jgi:hypothetical protein
MPATTQISTSISVACIGCIADALACQTKTQRARAAIHRASFPRSCPGSNRDRQYVQTCFKRASRCVKPPAEITTSKLKQHVFVKIIGQELVAPSSVSSLGFKSTT